MDLHALAWMVRDAGQSVGCVRLLDDHRVLAGGWDGDVRCWDAEGNLLWSASTPDRVSAITPWGDAVALTSGLHVVVLDLATGAERWSRPLEGSADLQCVLGDHLLTTSSVYDIEHFDFLESAAWLHDLNGNELHVERLDERPWALARRCCLALAAPAVGCSPPPTDGPSSTARLGTTPRCWPWPGRARAFTCCWPTAPSCTTTERWRTTFQRRPD